MYMTAYYVLNLGMAFDQITQAICVQKALAVHSINTSLERWVMHKQHCGSVGLFIKSVIQPFKTLVTQRALRTARYECIETNESYGNFQGCNG